jgi:carboxylesterase
VTLDGAAPISVEGGSAGLVLLHGFGGSPAMFVPVAEAAREADLTFRAPLLPGHGTSTADLGRTTFGDWVEAAATHVSLLGHRCDTVVVGGFSAGGAVAAAVASAVPVDGLVLVNAFLEVDPEVQEMVLEAAESGWDELPEPDLDISDPEGASGYVCYEAIPTRTLRSVHESLAGALAGLSGVTAPALLIASDQDHVVAPAWVDSVGARLRKPAQVVRLARSFHLAPLDVERDQVAQAVVAFALRP